MPKTICATKKKNMMTQRVEQKKEKKMNITLQ